MEAAKRPGDVVIFSIYWGSNWGYDIPTNSAPHSSHHPRGIEVYRERLILYGAGDFLNDYEGIPGQEEYRGDLTLAYFPTLDPETGRLLRLEMTPFHIRHFPLNKAS